MGTRSRAGIVLAGGYSTRFGQQEEALAELDGTPLLVHAVTGIAPAVDGVVVNCRRDQLPAFRRALTATPTDVVFVCDPAPDRGPAAGLATALSAVAAPVVAVVACDMPFVDAAFLTWLFEEMRDADGAVPYVGEESQPTHSVFATEPTRRAAAAAVRNGSGSLRDVLDRLDVVEIPERRLVEQTQKASFLDIDTPAELETVIASDTSGSHNGADSM
jgi:molybdopterin-guanine dinucleotide biosynthesis protein A